MAILALSNCNVPEVSRISPSAVNVKPVPGINNIRNIPVEEISELVADNNLDLLIINTMKKYLKDAVKLADELNFDLIKHEILMMKESVEVYERC